KLPLPPTSTGAGPSLPVGPWHVEQARCVNVSAPCVALPLPGGSAEPSGPTEMSRADSSRAVGGRPRPLGPRAPVAGASDKPMPPEPRDSCAWRWMAAAASQPATTTATSLCGCMVLLPVVFAVVVVDGNSHRRQAVGDVAVRIHFPRLDPVAVTERG